MYQELEQTLSDLFSNEKEILHQTARYSLEGGKRIRPCLTLAVLETFDIPIEKGLYPAAAIEMIHTYSLIHDDLPCMDNDDWRRGKPSLHKAFEESHAVLTGDFLLTFAFETLAHAPLLTDSEKNALIATLALRAGAKGMIGGQILDLEKKFEEWEEMYDKKTGALFSAALEFGAILVKADVKLFQKIGCVLGRAFQLMDDLIDQNALIKIQQKEKMVKQFFGDAKTLINQLPDGAPKLQKIVNDMNHLKLFS